MGTIPQLTTPETLRSVISDPSLDSQTCLTQFYLTGFSRFHNVPVNPTEEVANYLPSYLHKFPLSKGAVLVDTRVLKVSAQTTRAAVESMHSEFDHHPLQQIKSPDLVRRRRVVLHLGVNAVAKRFQLEIQARNEATFSCPDELGWAPIKREIDSNLGDLTATCTTSLRVPAIVRELCDRGFDVEQSTDAGRFVCNWTYFHSLARAKHNGTHVLFVHVPPAKVISVEKQTHFIRELMDVIAHLQ